MSTATEVPISRRFDYPSYVDDKDLEKRLGFGPNQKFSIEKKYLVRDSVGNLAETPAQAVYRMSRTLAEVETQYGASPERVDELTHEFYEEMASGRFSPAGRIWTNAGTSIKGLFNCYVLPVDDDLGEIFGSVRNAALIHKNGGGTGYNFSQLRPRGTYVEKSKGIASGVVSFIGQFDKETEVINSGNRRGANMGIVDVQHPDILDFIYAKTKRGEITNFNVSVGMYDAFMEAAKAGQNYQLEFPSGVPFTADKLEDIVRNIEENKVGGSEVKQQPKPASLRFEEGSLGPGRKVIFGKTRVVDTYAGEIAGRVNESGGIELSATYVLDRIASLAHETADPGMIFLDAINRDNPLPKKGRIMATNPCGEQPLHPYDACNLGSVILNKFVVRGGDGATIDYASLERTVTTMTRFMDNVNDANQGPIPEVESTTKAHRRIGMGVMGWADMLVELGVSYGSPESLKLAEEVMGFITDTAKKASVELAKEKGVFPEFEGSKWDTGRLEDRVRNVERTTIAPTGTISMVYDVSSGIEPFFALLYTKNIRGGDELAYVVKPFQEECERRGIDLKKVFPLINNNHGSIQGLDEHFPKDMQDLFKTAHDLDFRAHIETQAAFQRRTDNAVSKTINLPHNATVSDIKDAYILAWETGCKGTTVYRDGCKEVQVLETGHSNKPTPVNAKPASVPEIMPAVRIRQRSPVGTMHVSVIYDPREGNKPLENFAQVGKGGEVVNADLEAISRLVSIIYRTGGTPGIVLEQLEGIGSTAALSSREGEIFSIPDAYAKAIRKFEMLRKEEGLLESLVSGEGDPAEISKKIADAMRTGNGISNHSTTPNVISFPCPECGAKLAPEEGCTKCHSCGYSKC